MKKLKKFFLVIMTVLLIPCCGLMMSACSNTNVVDETVYLVSMVKTSTDGNNDIYTITYSNGTTSTFVVANGRDGQDVTIEDIYRSYCESENSNISLADFLKQYLTLQADYTAVIGDCLHSSMKIYTGFVTKNVAWDGRPGSALQVSYELSFAAGSAVIYQIDDNEDGDTYIVTNYHVVYNGNAVTNNHLATEYYGYLYGSEGQPVVTENQDEIYGYTEYSGGNYGVSLTYVGGSAEYDLAILKVKTSALKQINPDIRAVTLAKQYQVGETAIAIGNTEDEGISVSQGIVSVDNEYIALSIDKKRYYRSVRIDTAIYEGNSGGGLFNKNGELIGITNAGDNTDQNVNFAVPLEIVRGVVNNVINYDRDNNDNTQGVYKLTLGVTVTTSNSRYVYDQQASYIKENVVIIGITENSFAEQLNLAVGDQITALVIDGETYLINRNFMIGDLLLMVRAGQTLQVQYLRDGQTQTTTAVTIAWDDLEAVA